MPRTVTYSTTLSTLDCGVCHVPFAIPSSYLAHLKETGESFWCPNGHKISYHEAENTRLKAQLDQAKADARWNRDRAERARADAEHQKARAAGYKGTLTKVKRRVGKGVCPCCNRSFVNLERHMAGQHPDYADAEP